MRTHLLLAGLAAAAIIPSAAAAQYYSAPAGHYDADGRWVAGASGGYYDRDGSWVIGRTAAPYAGENDADVAYTGADLWIGAPLETRAREDWLGRRIRRAQASGRLGIDQAADAFTELDAIRTLDERDRSYSGELSPNQEAMIQDRLDGLRNQLFAWSAE
jgi:hypothetical protein